MHESDALLLAGWDDFCERLKQAGRIALDPAMPGGPQERSAGLRQVARNIALALQFELENCDPLHPQLLHYFDPVRKQGGDNPDALYLGAPINGTDHYRITGHRGSADYVAITAVERGGTPFGGGVSGVLLGDELDVEEDGSFVINIGPEPCGQNWLRTSSDTYRVTIRQFFGDWEVEEPMRASIQRIGSFEKRPVPQPDELVKGLQNAVEWLDWSVGYWAQMLARWKQWPGEFRTYSETVTDRVDATPGGEPFTAYWMLAQDEALMMRFRPPAARYWSVELGNAWWESMDYRDRLSSFNHRNACLEEDGEVVFIISHKDPGTPNWLDASGHTEGFVTFRWIGTETQPRPTMKRVSCHQLDKEILSCRRVTTSERRAQISARQRGLIKRFGS